MAEKDIAAGILQSAEMVEGPYYGSPGPLRADIREDCAGVPLDLRLQVKDISTGQPLSGIRVDIWHSDAKGYYSGYDNNPDRQPESVQFQSPINDETYLRGAQETDADGCVAFKTIYPGWYATRAPHIHVKVYQGEICILTTQFYFSENWSNKVYVQPEYRREVAQDTFNRTDTVLAFTQQDIGACWVDISETDNGYVGNVQLGIDLNAVSRPENPPEGWVPPIGGMPHPHPMPE